MTHPAQYSPEVLAAIRDLLDTDVLVHDPFAGAGERLGALCDELGIEFSGTEIEAAFIVDPRVAHGNSTDDLTYPIEPYTIVTSPVYPNGMADDFDARDGSKRRTYRSALAKLTGKDVSMHPDNQGRWGYRGTPLYAPARAVYWSIADRVISCWQDADAAIVNVSDFIAKDRQEPVVAGWTRLLTAAGWDVSEVPVSTKRWKHGANRDRRVETEVLLLCSKDPGLSEEDAEYLDEE